MANDPKNGENSDSGSNGGTTSSSNNSGTEDYNTSAKRPSDTPVTDNAASSSNSEQAGSRERTVDEPKKEVKKEEVLSLEAEISKARTEGIMLGIKDAKALENYAIDAGNKSSMGIAYNPVDIVRNVAGDMAAAVAQFTMESRLTTSVAVADHAFVGNGVNVAKQPAASAGYTQSA